jgi:spore germination protein KC
MRRVALLGLVLCLLTGCLGGQDIRERALIQLMGIDYTEGVFHLTLQIFSPNGQSEEINTEEQRQVVTAMGDTLSQALQDASLRVGRAAFLGDCRAIVVGERTARNHLKDIMRFLSSNEEVYPQMVLLIAAGQAQDILNPQTEDNQVVVASSLENITGSAVAKEAMCPSDLLTLARSYYTEGAGTAILRVRRQDAGEQVTFVPDGVALYNRDTPAGRLDNIGHRGMLTLRGLGRGSLLHVDDAHLGRLALQIKRLSVSIKTAIMDGQPRFDITVKAELLLAEMSDNPADRLSAADISRLQDLAGLAIRADALSAFEQAAAQGCDAFGLYRYLRRDQPAYWKQHAANWPAHIREADCAIAVDAHVARVGD